MNKAFTLVELAIVLVIIGLITGGVLGAQSLVESANRQSIIKDVTNLKVALHAFKLEYDALPGDFDEAEDYFDGGTSAETYEGNGNKEISSGETRRVFAHLGAAKLVNGTYTASDPFTPGLTSVESGYRESGYNIVTSNTGGSSDQAYVKRRGEVIIRLAATGTGERNGLYAGIISPNEAKKFDKKFDDGEPDDGDIFIHKGYDDNTWQTGCVSNNPANSAGAGSWSATEDRHCNIIFWSGIGR